MFDFDVYVYCGGYDLVWRCGECVCDWWEWFGVLFDGDGDVVGVGDDVVSVVEVFLVGVREINFCLCMSGIKCGGDVFGGWIFVDKLCW